jgi:hypothetical protein
VVFYKNDCWTDQRTVRIDMFYWVVLELGVEAPGLVGGSSLGSNSVSAV